MFAFSDKMFALSGSKSELDMDVFPHMDLSKGEWEIGLLSISTFNTIPNIETNVNDTMHFGDGHTIAFRTGKTKSSVTSRTERGIQIVFPEGTYHIEDIHKHVVETCKRAGFELDFKMHANNNTLKVELFSSMPIDFTQENSIGSLMGFEKKILNDGVWHIGERPASLFGVGMIQVVCNVAHGSLFNGVESHVIHAFHPTVEPGFRIVEIPDSVIYMPVSTKHLKSIKVRLEDDRGRLINLRGEQTNVRLHLRKKK